VAEALMYENATAAVPRCVILHPFSWKHNCLEWSLCLSLTV
jgi:hypothetical protein